MLIDPRHLHILSAIVDEGGMSEGARALGKSQPSLSRIVGNLEARLGEPLFEPGRRPLKPTDLCLRLAAEGRIIGRATQTAQDIATQFSAGHVGRIRVAGTPIFMDGVVSNMIAAFQEAHAGLRIDQSYGYATELVEGIRSGTIDIGICPMEPDVVPEDMVFQSVLKGRNVIACGPAHPLARQKSFHLENISEYPWITQPAGSPLFQDLKDVLASVGVTDFKVSYSGGTLSSILNVLTGSRALTVLPYSVVYMQPRNSIAALPIRIEHPKRHLGLMWHASRDHTPAVKRFIRHIARQFDSISRAVVEKQRQQIWRE